MKENNEDRTDPFIEASDFQQPSEEEIVYENEYAKLTCIAVAGGKKLKWVAKDRLIEQKPKLNELLKRVLPLLPFAEDLLLHEAGFTTELFEQTVQDVLCELSLAEMLEAVADVYTIEHDLASKAEVKVSKVSPSKVLFKDTNETSIGGYRWFKLGFFSLEDTIEAESASFELTRNLAEIFVDELKRRNRSKDHPRGFRHNVEIARKLMKQIGKDPSKAGEIVSRLSLNLEVASLTHKGLIRPQNEDALLTAISELNGLGYSYQLLAVADGMGGHAAGEVASNLCLELLRCYAPSWALAKSAGASDKDMLRIILEHIKLVNGELVETSEKLAGARGMGTTLTGLYFCYYNQAEKQIHRRSMSSFVFNVGDSRTFAVGYNGVKALTKDHSFVQELVDAGKITEDEAFHHPQKNIVSQAMGTNRNIKPDVFGLHFPLDAFIVIASDGLTDLVHKRELEQIARNADTSEELANSYLSAALKAGGTDNISIIVVKPQLLEP